MTEMHRPRIVVIIQARMTSSRLPGKVLKEVCGKPMLALMVERLQRVPTLDDIVIATTTNATDDPVLALANDLGVGCFRGSEENVLSRVLGAARAYTADIVVRTTGDCPLIDPEIVNQVITTFLEVKADYVSNTCVRTYPIGMDTEVFTRTALEDISQRTSAAADLEHVTPYFHKNPEIYRLQNVAAPAVFHDPTLRLTLDTADDFKLISEIFTALYLKHPNFTLGDILAFIRTNPDLRDLNDHVEHNWIRPIF